MSSIQFIDIISSTTKDVTTRVPVPSGPYHHVHSAFLLNEHDKVPQQNGSSEITGFQNHMPSVDAVNDTPSQRKRGRNIFDPPLPRSMGSNVSPEVLWYNIAPSVQAALAQDFGAIQTSPQGQNEAPSKWNRNINWLRPTRQPSSGERPSAWIEDHKDYKWLLADSLQEIRDQIKSNTFFSSSSSLQFSPKSSPEKHMTSILDNTHSPSSYSSPSIKPTHTPPIIKGLDRTIFNTPPPPPSTVNDHVRRTSSISNSGTSTAPTSHPSSPVFADTGSGRPWSEDVMPRGKHMLEYSPATSPLASPVVADMDSVHPWEAVLRGKDASGGPETLFDDENQSAISSDDAAGSGRSWPPVQETAGPETLFHDEYETSSFGDGAQVATELLKEPSGPESLFDDDESSTFSDDAESTDIRPLSQGKKTTGVESLFDDDTGTISGRPWSWPEPVVRGRETSRAETLFDDADSDDNVADVSVSMDIERWSEEPVQENEASRAETLFDEEEDEESPIFGAHTTSTSVGVDNTSGRPWSSSEVRGNEDSEVESLSDDDVASAPAAVDIPGRQWSEGPVVQREEAYGPETLFDSDESCTFTNNVASAASSDVRKPTRPPGANPIITRRPVEELIWLKPRNKKPVQKKRPYQQKPRETPVTVKVRAVPPPVLRALASKQTGPSRGVKRAASPMRASVKRPATLAKNVRSRAPVSISTLAYWSGRLLTWEDQVYQGKEGYSEIGKILVLFREMLANVEAVPFAWLSEAVRTRTVKGVEERKTKATLVQDILHGYYGCDQKGELEDCGRELLAKWDGLVKL
ncbi:hypothetical protein DFH09DRAFT_1130799 [Mycena vulgaris]|nr:hypothetical protein DFH09DRAFT_1130799 [Mycena vulgaris]